MFRVNNCAIGVFAASSSIDGGPWGSGSACQFDASERTDRQVTARLVRKHRLEAVTVIEK
jgi:hypothetical protein